MLPTKSGTVGRADTADERTRHTAEADVAAGPAGDDTAVDAGQATDRIDDLGAVEVVRAGVVDADGGRHAVTELPAVLDIVDAGDRVEAADQERGVVAGIAMPRRGEGREGLAEGEACELDEHRFDPGVAVVRGVVVHHPCGCGGVDARRETDAARVTVGPETEAGLTKGADHAVFRRGTGIDRQRHARTAGVEIRIAVAEGAFTGIEREVIDAAVDRHVDAQITTQLDAVSVPGM